MKKRKKKATRISVKMKMTPEEEYERIDRHDADVDDGGGMMGESLELVKKKILEGVFADMYGDVQAAVRNPAKIAQRYNDEQDRKRAAYIEDNLRKEMRQARRDQNRARESGQAGPPANKEALEQSAREELKKRADELFPHKEPPAADPTAAPAATSGNENDTSKGPTEAEPAQNPPTSDTSDTSDNQYWPDNRQTSANKQQDNQQGGGGQGAPYTEPAAGTPPATALTSVAPVEGGSIRPDPNNTLYNNPYPDGNYSKNPPNFKSSLPYGMRLTSFDFSMIGTDFLKECISENFMDFLLKEKNIELGMKGELGKPLTDKKKEDVKNSAAMLIASLRHKMIRDNNTQDKGCPSSDPK